MTHQRVLTLPCDVCGKSVVGASGYVTVSYQEISRVEERIREWDTRRRERRERELQERPACADAAALIESVMTGTELLDYPDAARWHIYHRDCDPDPDEQGYWWSVERCCTYRDLILRTAHVMGKSWLEHTDWDRFLYRVVAAQKSAS